MSTERSTDDRPLLRWEMSPRELADDDARKARAEAVRAELTGFIRTAGLWHFDDGMEDQIEARTGERSFSAWEVATVTPLLDEAFDLLGEEVWELGMAELRRIDPALGG